MEDTGRIRRPLDPRARRIVFGDDADRAIEGELPFYVQVDRAHLVMLLETGVLPRESGRRLLAAMDELAASDYAPLRGRRRAGRVLRLKRLVPAENIPRQRRQQRKTARAICSLLLCSSA